jgi:C_GCAxxG_C_C family probable redox protein
MNKTKKEEKAKAYFEEGYNCAQAVLLAFADELNMDKNTIIKLASSFGGGMGRLREVCGAVSGMFMAAGILWGDTDPNNHRAKTEHYQRIQKLARQFKEIHGSIICRDLLGLTLKQDDPSPKKRTAAYYRKRPCVQLVSDAARILEEMIRR